jgi:hypothetical protein
MSLFKSVNEEITLGIIDEVSMFFLQLCDFTIKASFSLLELVEIDLSLVH